ncbi:probable serine/threonine-protein kinase DDB_G0282963 [Aplysia californica]|nr:probable serine/threonine-protein kinase DDB_G0282963 [Aplysia californica]
MEDRFEELTRRLQAERETISQHARPTLSPGADSDTASSMASITSTDDSFRYHGNHNYNHPHNNSSSDQPPPPYHHHQQQHSNNNNDDNSFQQPLPGHSPDSSKMSSHLLDSCL